MRQGWSKLRFVYQTPKNSRLLIHDSMILHDLLCKEAVESETCPGLRSDPNIIKLEMSREAQLRPPAKGFQTNLEYLQFEQSLLMFAWQAIVRGVGKKVKSKNKAKTCKDQHKKT